MHLCLCRDLRSWIHSYDFVKQADMIRRQYMGQQICLAGLGQMKHCE